MRLATLGLLLLTPLTGFAQATPAGPQLSPAGPQLSPAGLWKTFSDRTGQPDGLVRIVEAGGRYEATVQAVFSPPAPSANPLCELCSGALKDQPVVGMKIVQDLRPDGDAYAGEILDPDDGKVYRCTMRLVEGGRKLEVRGYIGIPLLGRTQVWQRQE